MNELIKVVEQDNQRFVNARDLYEKTGVKSRFIDWIDNHIKRLGFIEGEDFFSQVGKSTGGRPNKEYSLTIIAAVAIAANGNDENGFKLFKYLMHIVEDWNSPERVIERARQAGAIILTEKSVLALEHLAAGMALSPFPGALATGIPANVERRLTEKDGGRVYILAYSGATRQRTILIYDHEAKFLDVALAQRDKWGQLTQDVKDGLERKYMSILGQWGKIEKVEYDDFFKWKSSLIRAGVTQPALPSSKVIPRDQISAATASVSVKVLSENKSNRSVKSNVLPFKGGKAVYIDEDDDSGTYFEKDEDEDVIKTAT